MVINVSCSSHNVVSEVLPCSDSNLMAISDFNKFTVILNSFNCSQRIC